MFNEFKNDSAYIATPHLLGLISKQGLSVKHLLRIVHISEPGSSHVAAVLMDG